MATNFDQNVSRPLSTVLPCPASQSDTLLSGPVPTEIDPTPAGGSLLSRQVPTEANPVPDGDSMMRRLASFANDWMTLTQRVPFLGSRPVVVEWAPEAAWRQTTVRVREDMGTFDHIKRLMKDAFGRHPTTFRVADAFSGARQDHGAPVFAALPEAQPMVMLVPSFG